MYFTRLSVVKIKKSRNKLNVHPQGNFVISYSVPILWNTTQSKENEADLGALTRKHNYCI